MFSPPVNYLLISFAERPDSSNSFSLAFIFLIEYLVLKIKITAKITTKANNIKLTHHKCGDLTNKTIAKTSKNSKKSKL